MAKTGFRSHSERLIKILSVITILLIYLHEANGAKILFFMGFGSHSHRVALQPLASKLAENGHEVTILSALKPEVENPQIKEFCPQALIDFNNQLHSSFGNDPVALKQKDRYYDPTLANTGQVLWDLLMQINEVMLASKEVLDWIDNTKFDLVINEHAGKEIALGIAHKHKAKVILINAAPFYPIDADIFGIPAETSWYPGWTGGSPYKFIPDRFYYEWNAIAWNFKYRGYYLPLLNEEMKKAFGEDIPPTEELIQNYELYFLNTHFSNEYARSLPPYIIPIGGMHVQETSKPLPKDLEDFISGGSDGFVFISFGSLAQISGLPMETQKDFFSAIASFSNARFLLKWNGDIPKDIPKNILVQKWFPQQDLLAHPKCRGFVSQGGLMSYQQATYNGVPVVIMPVFGDQPFNARTAAHQGNGIHLELADLAVDTFSDAIRQLLFSESLSAKAKEVSRRFKDRPMSPVDTAVWWTEYVLRHNDTSHLKPLGINQTWWQRRMLDFWAIIFTLITLATLSVFLALRNLIRLCKKSPNKGAGKVKTS